jgi:serine/threonine-protein kinase
MREMNAEANEAAGPVVTLSVVEGPSSGRACRAERATAIVGRAEDCDPRIDEPGDKQLVSRHHCLFGAIDALLQRLVAADGALPEIRGHELVKKLGDGGQGAVYLARRQPSAELVAVKMLLAKVAVKARSRAMFEREIERIQALNHPNVVAFREAGGSVDDLIDREGPLPPDRAVPMVLQALAGLGYAHTAPLPDGSIGLVHRDIKPGNILLARRGRDLVAKVADFGLAKAFDRAGLSGMTMTGAMGGTMPFMARPQLIQYKYAKPDVDVWSMAASLYWLLTRHYPRTFGRWEDPIRVVLDTMPVPRITVTSAAELAAALIGAL